MISSNIKQINSCLKYPVIFDDNNIAILSSDVILLKYQLCNYVRYSYAIAEYVLLGDSIQLLYHIYANYPFHMKFHQKNEYYFIYKTEDKVLNDLPKQESLFLKKRKKSVYHRSNWTVIPELVTDLSEQYKWDSGFASYIGLTNNKQHIDFLFLNKKKLLS
jgi:hypothetical protein